MKSPRFNSLFQRHLPRVAGAKRGFTFIEVLITTALSLIILGGSVVSYNTLQARQTQMQTAKDVMIVIDQARTRAAAGDKPSSGCTTLQGYRVRAVRDSATYYLSVICSNGELEVEALSLAEGYIFRDTSFDITYGVQPGPVSSGTITVDIATATGTKAYRFQILSSGAIDDQGVVDL